MIRNFELHRTEDATGISGTGIVAQGSVFDDGTCALRWLTEERSTAVYSSLGALKKIHGHGGKTKIVMVGSDCDPFRRGWSDAGQDACENAPFASVGGLAKRSNIQAPEYITPSERLLYLDGYRTFAFVTYGKDWQTCAFGWSPAIELPCTSELPSGGHSDD